MWSSWTSSKSSEITTRSHVGSHVSISFRFCSASLSLFFFFFQAEDGIRDFHVTGVQTCALPIFLPPRCPSLVHCVDGKPVDALATVVPLTIGGVRDVLQWRGVEGGIGAAATLYAVPTALKATHGDHPVSFQIFFRLRPPAGSMGRMWNMRMSQPMQGMSHDQMAAEPPSAQGGLTISFTSPRPRAKIGNNRLEVLVKDRAGKPLAGADVSALFVMPAMPGMSEMRR